jgi:PTH1 family peptidyl-tRNA hydrolase
LPSRIELIIGLGNPGPDYENTRHNIGFWFVDALAQMLGVTFKPVSRLYGHLAEVSIDRRQGRLFKPTTFMNHSGQAVATICKYFKIAPENILIVHDEIDLPPGTVRLKRGGGHGGHNGLRDIISALQGNRDFLRLRIGVGHPGSADEVVDYVLHKPSRHDKELINNVIDESIDLVPMIMEGEFEMAMNRLHSLKGSLSQGP